MKKLLAVVLCFMLIATSWVVAFAEATVDATITVATVEGPLAAGDKIALPITITQWANSYGGFKLDVVYDDTLLKLESLEQSDLDFGGALCTINENELSLIASPISEKQAENVDGGEICIAYFVATENITTSTVVSVNAAVYGYTYGKEDGWIEVHALSTEVISGGVKVDDAEPPTPDIPEPEEPEQPELKDTTLTVATVKGYFTAGDEIAIPVTIAQWENGYASMDILISYDNTVLSLNSIEASQTDFGSALISTNNNRVGLIASPTSTQQANQVKGGEVCVAYFVALADIVDSTTVTATASVSAYSYGEADNWTTDEDLNVTVVAGGVEYEAPTECIHSGETEIRDYIAPNCNISGYSGDTYCKTCGEKIANGETIPATGDHQGGEATCSAKAECSVCGQEYGEFDLSNHKNTTYKGGYAPTCGANGKEDDLFCNDCQKVIEEGKVIPATGEHTWNDGVVTKTSTCAEEGVKTYTCIVCNQTKTETIEKDATNHTGETEILDATNKYTGDTYCVGCHQMLSKGQKYGDVNGDGEIAAEDALLVLQHSVDKIELTGIDAVCADVDNNGIVDATDALLILQFSVDKITGFPREN